MNNLTPLDVVLALTDSKFNSSFNMNELLENPPLLDKAQKLADKNGLYYLFSSNLERSSGNKSFLNTDRWILEQERLRGFVSCLSLLNDMSRDCRIQYLLIKACTKIPHVPRDVDIYVHSKDVCSIIDYLGDKGMVCVHSDPVDTTIAKGETMKIDLYTGLCYFTVNFFDDNFLWESKNIDYMHGIKIPSLKDETNFMILLIHSLFGHRSISLLDLLQIGSFLDKPIDLDFCRNMANDYGWGKTFDLSAAKIEYLCNSIKLPYERSHLSFPYLFDRKFIIQCIYEIENLNISKERQLFLNLSLIQDGVVLRLKDSFIYNILKSFGPARSTCNNLGYFIRNKRGDLRSKK